MTMHETPPRRSTVAPTLLFAASLATFAAAGATIPGAFRMFDRGAGASAGAGTALLAAIAAGVAVGALLAGRAPRGGPGAARGAVRGQVLLLCAAVVALGVAPPFFEGMRAASALLWGLIGGTTAGDWLLRLGPALAMTGLPAAVLAALVVSLSMLARAEGVDEGPAAGFSLGLAGAGLAIGMACGGAMLLPALGLRSTYLVGLGLAGAGAALAALVLPFAGPVGVAGGSVASAGVDRPGAVPGAGRGSPLAPAAIFMAGLGLAAAGVGWWRTVALVAGPTEANFLAFLMVVALALGLGGILAAGVTRAAGAWTAVLLAAAAIAAHGSMYLVPALAERALAAAPWFASSGAPVLLAALLAAALALPGTVLVGWAIGALAAGRSSAAPGATGAGAGPGRSGGLLPRTLAGFAAGAALGGLLSAMVVVPALGLRRAVGLAAAALALGAAVHAASLPWRAAAVRLAAVGAPVALALAAGYFAASWDPRIIAGGIYRYGASAPERFGSTDRWLDGRRRGAAPLFYREGAEAVVVVERSIQSSPGLDPIETFTLTLDGRSAAGTGTDLRTQVLAGHIPILLHASPARALLIELLTGVTAGSMLRHPIESLTVIEREPVVAQAAALFGPLANQPLADARLLVVHDDPRARLATDPARYDVIVLAAGDPWLPHASGLMTTGGYALMKSRLTDGGLVAQRVSLGAFTPGALAVLLRTFAASFTSVMAFQLTPDDLLLAGSDGPLALDGSRLRSVVGSNAGVAEDLGRAVVVGANEVIMTLRLDRDALLKVAGDGPLNDDDHAPILQAATRHLAVQRNDKVVRAIEAAWPGFAPLLVRYGADDREKADFLYSLAKSYLGLTADPVRGLDIARELDALGAAARARWVTGEALLQQRDIDGALREWEAVLALEPDNLDALFSLGTFHLDGRDDRAAERYLARAAASHPGASVVRYHHGRVLFNLGRYREAVDELRRARSLGSGGDAFPLADYLVGLASARLQRDDDAVTALRAYLKWAYAQQMLTRVEVDAHLKLSEVLERKGRRFDALQERQKGDRLLKSIEAWGRMQQASGAPATGAPAPGTGPARTPPAAVMPGDDGAPPPPPAGGSPAADGG